ncbi:PaaI family thioesterase [Myxococcota bacterium]|nr:PaaI family thioesterase [Myxococcota bacterium]
MSTRSSEIPSVEDLAAASRAVANRVRCVDAPEPVLRQAIEALERVQALLAPHAVTGPYTQSSLKVGERFDGFAAPGTPPEEIFPYSPIIGPRNPLSPPVRFERHGEEVQGEVCFPPTCAGAPGLVHGGLIAATFDELLGIVHVLNGEGAMTGTLTVRYVRPTPLETPLSLVGRRLRREGRKVYSSGELHCDGELTARAEGVFIRVSAETVVDR